MLVLVYARQNATLLETHVAAYTNISLSYS